MVAPREPVFSVHEDGDAPGTVHLLLFRCPHCHRPIVTCIFNEFVSLEVVDGMSFKLRCDCSWTGERLGTSAKKHLIERWAA